VQTLKTNAFMLNSLRRMSECTRDPAWLSKAGVWALVIAFFLRVFWAFAVPVVPVSDSDAYDVFAQNIASGYGFCWKPGELTAYWAVGASALYALIYSVFGHNYVPIVVLNIVVGLGTVALAMSLARRWLGPFPAVLTGWILALWPQMVEFTTILASELLFNFCVLLAFWLATMPGWKWLPRAVVAGIVLAAAVYIRPVALLLAPLIYLPEALNQKKLARAAAACTVSCVIMIALILPWSMRNLHVFDHFVLVSTNAGANFWMGNNPDTTGGYMPLPETGIANEAERDRYFSQKAWEYIRLEPLAFVTRTLKKTLMLHDRETIGIAWNEKGLEQRYGSGVLMPLKLINNPYWWLILVCAVYGLIMLFHQRTWLEFLTLPPLTAWAYFAALHGITVTGDRYHVPSDPFIAMLAAFAICVLVERVGMAKEVEIAHE
jgi:hypothetical protein